MKYIFIVNETAGRGKYKKILPNIEIECKKRQINYEIRYITKDFSSEDIAREYKNEENIIYVVGGDGTITKTLPGIVGTKNKLGIIPSGSGNDTYRTVKILPKGENLIDLGKINDTYFINVACTGIDAEVANNVDKLRNTIIPTSQLYNASIFIYKSAIAPKLYDKYLNTGIKYLMDGQYEEAILAFDKAIKIEPKTTEARVYKAKAYIGNEELDKAVKRPLA